MKSPIRIMLVDDHQMILDSLSLLLRLMENVIIEAKESDSRKVIAILNKVAIDVLVTDYNMPYLDGIQLTRLVKEKHPEIKVLILTVNEESEDIQQAFHAGASGYIMKKANRRELEEAINTVVEGKLYFGQEAMKAMFSPSSNTKNLRANFEHKLSLLTPRELEIIKLLSKEKSSTEIADELFISVGTVETHRHNILKKLGVKSTIGVVKFAIKAGIE